MTFCRYSSKPSIDNSNKDMMNEVQDFSMPSKVKQMNSNKGKLDSMLDKFVKRKNIVSIFFINFNIYKLHLSIFFGRDIMI